MPLTDTACRNAKCPEDRDRIRLTDAGGFYLEVTRPSLRNPAGSKLWRYKFRHVGKEKLLALGVYPKVSLADARKEHQKARALVAAGDDPSEVRKDAKLAKLSAHETSFEPVARQWWSDWKRGKTARYADDVMCRLEADAFPVIGHKPVADLAASYFVRMSKKIEARGAEELARRVLQTCGQVMRWAVAHELPVRNPVADVMPADFLKPREVKTRHEAERAAPSAAAIAGRQMTSRAQRRVHHAAPITRPKRAAPRAR